MSSALYVKNIPNEWSLEILSQQFKPFGSISSLDIKFSKTGSKYAVVSYENQFD